NIQFDAVAGYSVGQYAALLAAGAYSFEEGLELVRVRSRAMDEIAKRFPSAMSAISGLRAATVEEYCQSAGPNKIWISNYSAPNHFTISGSVSAVEEVERLAREAKALKVVRLTVNGAWHSPLMKEAVKAVSLKIKTINWEPLQCFFIDNATGHEADLSREQDTLLAHLTKPVQWTESIQSLVELGFDTCLEAGPPSFISKLCGSIQDAWR
ncbi:MAG: ACP S-malonyltransferase, partial [Candidatus Lindowbacteria bacterium]|nr:ACP S-malonyltransferase [Candidatus Lindowbacteria bacterium]